MIKRRAHVTAKDQASVLRQSRRRCCICFGLNRDDSVKKGQIAHLDKDPSNARPDNLAWLCLVHHDEYDSTTRQSKSLYIDEVKSYRSELYETFASWENIKTPNRLLRFLAATIDDDAILGGEQ